MNRTGKIFPWVPRILCILAILFVSMFAADSFEGSRPFGQKLVGFLIHLVPSFILAGLLVVAWFWELIGGIIFVLIGGAFTPMIYLMNFQRNHSVAMSLGIVALITLPFVLIGILFIASHFLKKKQAAPEPGRIS